MAATVQFQTQLTYKQVFQLVHQLPAKHKRRLARLLEKETTVEPDTPTPLDESELTPLRRKTVANIRQGFKELKLVKAGKMQTRPLSDVLNEL